MKAVVVSKDGPSIGHTFQNLSLLSAFQHEIWAATGPVLDLCLDLGSSGLPCSKSSYWMARPMQKERF